MLKRRPLSEIVSEHLPVTASEQAKPQKLIPSPISGMIPPVHSRFKPGQSGNPGGRPKIIGKTLEQKLLENNGEKLHKITDSLIRNACLLKPHAVSAFRTIRDIVEPPEPPKEEPSAQEIDRSLIREFLERLMTRRVSGPDIMDV